MTMSNNDYIEFKEYMRRMLIENAVLLFIGIIVLIICNRMDAILGWVWGSISDIVYLIILYRNMMKLLKIDEANRNTYINKVVGRRFFIVCVLLVIAGIVPQINILATTAGIISFKFLIYIDQFVVKPFILPRLKKKNL